MRGVAVHIVGIRDENKLCYDFIQILILSPQFIAMEWHRAGIDYPASSYLVEINSYIGALVPMGREPWSQSWADIDNLDVYQFWGLKVKS